jgi:hypothetical protein
MMQVISGEAKLSDSDFIQHHDVWYSWHAHGSIYALTKEDLKSAIESKVQQSNQAFKKADICIITLGTAWIYQLVSSGMAVANCHKQPASVFQKKLLSVQEVEESLMQMIHLMKGKKIILTVSPVKYLRDGVVENARSKAILLEAVHRVCAIHHDAVCFPAYEIVTDELRDYRFFAADGAHPNQIAIDYVWQKVTQTLFDEPTQQYLTLSNNILQRLQHSPLHPDSKSHQQMQLMLKAEIKQLQQQFPHLKMSFE